MNLSSGTTDPMPYKRREACNFGVWYPTEVLPRVQDPNWLGSVDPVIAGSTSTNNDFDACLQVVQPVAFIGGGLCPKQFSTTFRPSGKCVAKKSLWLRPSTALQDKLTSIATALPPPMCRCRRRLVCPFRPWHPELHSEYSGNVPAIRRPNCVKCSYEPSLSKDS